MLFAPLNPQAWADLFGTGPGFGSGFIHPGLVIGVVVAIVLVALARLLRLLLPSRPA